MSTEDVRRNTLEGIEIPCRGVTGIRKLFINLWMLVESALEAWSS